MSAGLPLPRVEGEQTALALAEQLAPARSAASGVPDEAERRARLALCALVEPGRWDVHDAVARFGAVEVAGALRRGARVGRVSAQVAASAARRAEHVVPQRDLDALHAVGGRLVVPDDAEWPTDRLAWSPAALEHAPPLALLLRGPHALSSACALAVGVVGARAATRYGQVVARDLGLGLAEAGAAVVSGLAHGIDGAAHRGALVVAGEPRAAPTVAVLGCGADHAYPADHDRLLEEVAEAGLVVSEVVCGTRPTRARFLVRNRLIAALADGVVVVEATHRSGSRSTAGRAQQLGRPLMAVPGPVTSPASEYPHHLLRGQEAVLVTSAAEVLEGVSRVGERLAPEPVVPRRSRDDLDREARAVLDALPARGPGHGEAQIALGAGVAPAVVARVLPPLELVGLVERSSRGWRLTALGASG